MSTQFEREPLEVSEFPSNLQKHVEADAPHEMKMMAAQGMVPAPPDQTVRLLYQLHFEETAEIGEAIEAAVAEVPEGPLVGALEDEDHPGVLDWIAEQRGDSEAVVEQLLRNDAASDGTVARLAAEADSETCELIATNEVRVLRSPEIIEKLYQNPSTRKATLHQLIELAQRNDVELDNLPGVQRAIRSKQDIFTRDQRAEDDGVDEDEFNELLEEEAEHAEREAEKIEKLQDEDLTRSEREQLRDEIQEELEEDEQEEERRRMTAKDLQTMTVAEKIRLATVGSRSVIKKLVEDPNRLVHMAAIESPQIKTPDAMRFASQKSIPEDVISYIANNREWTQNYNVVKALLNNPKTPVSDSLDLINRLRNNDLKKLQTNRDVPHQVTRAAERLYQKRTGQGGGRGRR